MPAGRALLGTLELASFLSPYDPERGATGAHARPSALRPRGTRRNPGREGAVVHKQFGSAGGGASGGLMGRGPSGSRPFFSLAQNC